MNKKKLTAWILFVAMLVTMIPSSLVLAATSEPGTAETCPIVTATMYVQDSSKVAGDDLLLSGANSYISAGDNEYDTVAKADEDEERAWHQADIKASTTPTSRRQALSISAESKNGGNFGVNHIIEKGYITYTFLDLAKNPLVQDADGLFTASPDGSYEWQDYADLPESRDTIGTFNESTEYLQTTRAINQQLAANNRATVVIWNIVKTDFEGYLRLKVQDDNGYATYQDILIIADGKYPTVEVSSETEKTFVGSDVATAGVDTTLIQGRVYREYLNEKNEVVTEEIDSPWNNANGRTDNAAMLETMEGYLLEEKYWANSDIQVSVVAQDEYISSELKSLSWELYNTEDAVSLNDEHNTEEKLSVANATLVASDVIAAPDYENGVKNTANATIATDITIENEGQNTLVITAEDKAGLSVTYYYYFFIDKTAPDAEFEIVELEGNVSLLTGADIVTNRQQALDIAAEDSDAVVSVISGVKDAVAGDINGKTNLMYQYRLLTRDYNVADADVNMSELDAALLPKGYTKVTDWTVWAGDSETPVIDSEFDGVIQVRVQDRAGNWSTPITKDVNSNETIIADNTNPVISVKEYALNTNGDDYGNSAAEILAGTATDILKHSGKTTATETGRENEVIHTTEGDVAEWINDTAVLAVNITDKDILDTLRSSGLEDGMIEVAVEFVNGSQTEEVKIWKSNGTLDAVVTADKAFTLKSEHLFGLDKDEDVTFYLVYEGTGAVDVTVSVKDQADVNDGDDFSAIYKTQLKVDKIAPYITFKGYDSTDKGKKDLLLPNTGAEYELRDMPWGPNNQVLEVTVKDDAETDVQSKVDTICFNSDKPLDLYKEVDGELVRVTTYKAGNGNTIDLEKDCTILENEGYESNVGRQFYLVYEGTGIAKVEFYAEDAATKSNVRDYPTASDANAYDAMLRVDRKGPKFDAVELKETAVDVQDVTLFGLTNAESENVTRKQMVIEFDILDNLTTEEQSGVTLRHEKPVIVKKSYNSLAKDNLYNNAAVTYSTDDNLEQQASADNDPLVDYILIPAYNLDSNGQAGTYALKDQDGEYRISQLSDAELKEKFGAKWVKATAKEGYWQEDKIVVPEEFQGAIILRTSDRVGNIAYSDPIVFVAESKSPLVKFETSVPEGKSDWETLNQYGWSKRDVYFEVKVKDQTLSDVDAGVAKVMVQSNVAGAMSLEGTEIGTAAQEVSLAGLKKDSEGYVSIGYVKATETSTLIVTVYDQADVLDEEETGNKTVAMYNVRIDKNAPVVAMDAVDVTVKNNEIVLAVDMSKVSDDDSGVAPLYKADDYNKFTEETLYDVLGDIVNEKGEKLHYYFKNSKEVVDYNTIPEKQEKRNGYVHENEAFEATQWEMPGVQYALIPRNDSVSNLPAWDFVNDPAAVYNAENGFNKEAGAINVWHNYVPGQIVANADFDGYIVVRVVDKAGNITLLGTSSILDVEFDNNWARETQFISVKASEKNGTVTAVEYFGNNDLLFPDGVHRPITTEALSGEGAFIEVVHEGITNVVIKSATDITAASAVTLSPWEGAMNIGSQNKDFKYQIVDVKIDKQAPEFTFEIKDENDNIVTDAAVAGAVKINLPAISDPTPNKNDKTMSQIASGIKSVEWCAVPEGSSEEKWEAATDWENGNIGTFDATAFTGTVKVRVTDNAGNVTEKSQKINIDKALPIISISNHSEGKCSHEPVTVFVTVSKNAEEFTDVNSVTYTITNTKDNAIVKENQPLPLTGGTITISDEGTFKVEVKATNKAGKEETANTTVTVHYQDLAVPALAANGADLKSGAWVTVSELSVVAAAQQPNEVGTEVWYSVNGGVWTKGDALTIEKGENIVRIQTRAINCLCESDVVTYAVNYDNKQAPNLSVSYDDTWRQDALTVTISANKGTSVSDIESISYTLDNTWDTADDPGVTRQLPATGGTFVIDKEGKWVLSNIIVTMESGVQYVQVFRDAQNGQKVSELAEVTKDTDLETKPFAESGVDLTPYSEIVAKIDRTVPVLTKVDFTNEGPLSLQIVDNNKHGFTASATDNSNTNITFAYAKMEKGTTVPEWVILNGQQLQNNEWSIESKAIISEEFDGYLLVKATDEAGNSVVRTLSVTAEDTDPEISVTTPASKWLTDNAVITIDVLDNGIASGIADIEYTLVKLAENGRVIETAEGFVNNGNNWANLNTRGGQIVISEEGRYQLTVKAIDHAGNSETVTVNDINIDKTAPTYSGSVAMSLFNVHTINNWDDIHDGWTYNHPVSISGICDNLSGINNIKVQVTTETGNVNETVLSAGQTGTSFSTDGTYCLTITDNAGNVRVLSFVIDKDLENVINVIGVDAFGKVHVAVTDGDEMLTFYSREDENNAAEVKIHENGVTDQLWDGRTGVRYIYGKNDAGEVTNKLHVLVAPVANYDVTLTGLLSGNGAITANRFMSVDCEGQDVTVTKVEEIFRPGIRESVTVNSILNITEDGIYQVTTR